MTSLHGRLILLALTFSLSGAVLGASSNRELDTTSHEPHESTLVFELLRRTAALDADQLTRENLMSASGVALQLVGRSYKGHIAASSRSVINLLLVEHKPPYLIFAVELHPSLPLPSPSQISQTVVDEYMANLRELGRQLADGPCISRDVVFGHLTKIGWRFFQTTLSSSLEEHGGNFLFQFGDERYLVLTLENDCLMAFDLSRRSSPPPELGDRISPEE